MSLRSKYSLGSLFCLILLLTSPLGFTQESEETPLTVEEIVKRSEEVHPGKDHASKLTFTIRDQDGHERKEVLRRFWKGYGGKGGLDFKLIVFNEYPPDKKGNAFLEWAYKPGSGKEPDRKFYLKFLNAVNKVPKGSDEGFASSDLKPSEMAPRPVELDRHKMLKEEVIESRSYYVIESGPKKHDSSYPYSKVVKWITKDDFLKEKLQYYNLDGNLFKEQTITWKKIKDAWV
ncbi:MAG: outer membrane lipoprotein-sorting protein, partial [Nitrospira sp.]|nr:outer membrane lipoprotein-sorting protein [Nitrospira sp.]